ncbi:MAG: glycerophosphodiester phosphodiesterase [Candidatus Thorarchaeota archaeon]|nr:glycerophosphodiester phosphodiesterase [Candidatus Thorarchaeota archaeon]
MQNCIIIGHRGAAGHAPENTLLSFQTAFEFGADMVELDIHETLDGHLVCIHDADVSRTTDGTGLVSEHTLNELRELDAGKGERIPLLSEVLSYAKNRLKVNIELKTLGVEKKIIDLLVERQMINDVVISSFYHGTLLVMKELDKRVFTAALISHSQDDLINYICELGVDALNPHYEIITNEIVSQAHNHGVLIYPWTVNDIDRMFDLIRNLRVDGIITDFPDIGVKARSEVTDS